jgi:hypothetical protein
MKELNPSTLFLNLSGRGFGYDQFCKTKMFVHMQLLLWNVEATVCDDDIVFLKNPTELFREESHFEVMAEHEEPKFHAGYRWQKFNVGFMRVIPSELSIMMYEKWIRRAYPNTKIRDQTSFHRILESLRRAGKPGQWSAVQSYRTQELLGKREDLKIRFHDPLLVSNCGTLTSKRSQAEQVARERNINEPHVVHMAYIEPWDKIRFLAKNGLYFLDEDEKCGGKPDKRLFRSWKK